MPEDNSKNYFSNDFKLGILGGGQLGKMLLYETRKFDIHTKVLEGSKDAPCKIACDEFILGNLLDFDNVYAFGKKVDVLTIEIEKVNIDALEKLEEEGIKVYPHAVEHGSLDFPFVWKAAQFGYDGQGVQVVRSLDDLNGLPEGECIAETMIPFKNELAVIVVRNPSGEVVTYPVVEMEFHPEANQVEYVICPARIDKNVAKKAQKIALKVSEKIDHIGILAVEMFQTEDDEILVNEVAPRPHNSGHYSIEASYTNQFEQHIRAILDLPLGKTESKVAGIMVNLVGAENHTGDVVYENLKEIMSMDGVTPHIYGKKQTRPFRKMGHVTIVNKDISEARKVAQKVKETIKVISK